MLQLTLDAEKLTPHIAAFLEPIGEDQPRRIIVRPVVNCFEKRPGLGRLFDQAPNVAAS